MKFSKNNPLKILIGNKCDLTHKRVISTETAQVIFFSFETQNQL